MVELCNQTRYTCFLAKISFRADSSSKTNRLPLFHQLRQRRRAHHQVISNSHLQATRCLCLADEARAPAKSPSKSKRDVGRQLLSVEGLWDVSPLYHSRSKAGMTISTTVDPVRPLSLSANPNIHTLAHLLLTPANRHSPFLPIRCQFAQSQRGAAFRKPRHICPRVRRRPSGRSSHGSRLPPSHYPHERSHDPLSRRCSAASGL